MKAYTKEQIENLLALETEYDDDFDHGWNMAIRTILKGVDLVDMEPVIRCKDCVHWEKSFECWCKGSKHYHCYMLDCCTDEFFYCKFGRSKLNKRNADGKEKRR